MKITPTRNFLLVRLEDMPSENRIVKPDAADRECYGVVVNAGAQCNGEWKVGDKVLFLTNNVVTYFDKDDDKRYIIPETSVFAMIDPEANQDDATS